MSVNQHSEYDNQTGLPKFVRESINQANRKFAATQKVAVAKHVKAGKYNGNGRTR